MIRGTTPTLTFELPMDISECERVCVTFSQNDKELFTVEKDDLIFDKLKILVTLSQKQTLEICSGSKTEIQLRAKYTDGTAIASNIFSTWFTRILKEGEI